MTVPWVIIDTGVSDSEWIVQVTGSGFLVDYTTLSGDWVGPTN